MKAPGNEFDDQPEEPRPVGETQDEVLVAYLDGQLPADQSERIEARLADDPTIRERMQTLDRVWNALDVLPRSTASPAFTRSTVEMAAVATDKPDPATKRRSWRVPLASLAVLLGLGGGAMLTLAMIGAPDRRALRDLPVAMNVEALANLGSVGFAEQLLEEAGPQVATFQSEQTADEARHWAKVSRMAPPERRVWLEAQPPETLSEVSSQVDLFDNRTQVKQESLRELVHQIDEHERAAEIREATLVYQEMIARLSSGEQSDLRQSTAAERLAIIKRSAQRWALDAALELDGAERATFRAGLDDLVSSDEYQRVADKFGSQFPWGRELRKRPPHTVLLMATHFAGRDRSGDRPSRRGPRSDDRSRIEAVVQQKWQEWFGTLGSALPKRVQKELAAADSDAQRARLFERLLRETLTEDLHDSFADLSNDQLQQSLLLPREAFIESLSGPEEGFAGMLDGPPGEGPPGGPHGFDGPGPRGGRFRGGDFPGGPPPRGGGRDRGPR